CTTLRNQILRHRFAILGARGNFRRRPTLEPETASAQSPHTTHQAREFMGSLHETYRATFGGALASRELWFGSSGSDRYFSLLCGLVTRVSGRIPSGATCPK